MSVSIFSKTPEAVRPLWRHPLGLIDRLTNGRIRSAPVRAALSSYFADRPETLVLAVEVLVVCTAAALLDRTVYLRLTTLACGAAAFCAGSWAGFRVMADDCAPSTWLLLFQRPGPPSDHFRRVAAVAMGMLAVLLLLIVGPATVIRSIRLGSPKQVAVTLIGPVLIAIDYFAAAVGISALTTKRNFVLVGTYVGVSVFGLPASAWAQCPAWLSSAIQVLLVPNYDPSTLVIPRPTPGWRWEVWPLAHMVIYPLAWFAVAKWRLWSLDRSPELPRDVLRFPGRVTGRP